MCYHIKITSSLDILAEQLGLMKPKGNPDEFFSPQTEFNGFDFNWTPIVTNEDLDQLRLAKWGLLLPNAESFKDQLKGGLNILNTTVEKYDNKRSVCHRYKDNHALMFVDGFYEWQHVSGGNRKTPLKKNRFLMTMPRGEVFGLACIYNDWYFPEIKHTIKTVSILTRPANSLMSHIHNTKKRMPVILDHDLHKAWLIGDIEMKDILEMDDYFESLPLDAVRR